MEKAENVEEKDSNKLILYYLETITANYISVFKLFPAYICTFINSNKTKYQKN